MTSITSVVASILSDYYGTTSTISTTSSSSTTSTTTSTTSSTSTTSYSNKTAVGRYLNSTSSDAVDAKTLFKDLSIDVGGDGKTITEDQLSSYIDEAESGTISVPDEELSALTSIQDNWDTISDGSDRINYYDVASSGYSSTLTSMSTETSSDTTDYMKIANDATIAAYSKVLNAALGVSSDSSSTSTLQSLLTTLLSGTTDESDDSNSELISTLTNLLASTTTYSTFTTDV